MSVTLNAPWPQLECSTVLPSPELSDTERKKASIAVRRAKDGTVRTYKKSSTDRALSYTFQLSRAKAAELEAFLNAYYSSRIQLENHKGEKWLVYFTSNPFEFASKSRAAPARETRTIQLTFEGIKV